MFNEFLTISLCSFHPQVIKQNAPAPDGTIRFESTTCIGNPGENGPYQIAEFPNSVSPVYVQAVL